MKDRLILALCFLALPVTIWAVIWLYWWAHDIGPKKMVCGAEFDDTFCHLPTGHPGDHKGKYFPRDPDAGYVRPRAEIHDDLLAANIETARLKAAIPAPDSTLGELLDRVEQGFFSDSDRKKRALDRQAIESLFAALSLENSRLQRFETYVCQVIAMGTQADLTVEALPR